MRRSLSPIFDAWRLAEQQARRAAMANDERDAALMERHRQELALKRQIAHVLFASMLAETEKAALRLHHRNFC